MKTNFLKSILLLTLTTGLLTSCVNDDDYATPNLGCTETNLVKTIEVADVPASTTVAQYTDDEIIEAYVTSSDKGGNFFKTISFQTLDGSRAFSVPVDVNSTFINFEPGRKVFIKLEGLYTDIRDGGVRIGAIFLSNGIAQVGRMPESEYRNALVRSCTVVPEDSLVLKLTIPQALNDANINKLIEFDDVQFNDDAITTTYYDANDDIGGATNHLLVDADGNTIVFRTSSFATYGSKPVADGKGKVRGVLTNFCSNGVCTYQFIARTEDDIQLTEERPIPIFAQNFESITETGNNMFVNLEGWTNVSMNGTEKWEARIFGGNKYAQMSSFGTNENNVDVRLITPALNLDNNTGESLRFGYKTGFANGVALTVWYSADYDGSGTVEAVNAATWTQFDVPLDVQDSSYSPTFYSSGSIDLSAITGNVYIAFRYQGASNGVTTTYQVDNIEIVGE